MDGPAVSDSTQIKIDRSLSGDFGGSRRVINVGSWGKTSSVSLSRDGSERILFEVVPDQCLAQVGDTGRPIDNDHEGADACDETASSGNSFEISRRNSFPKYSSSRQRDSWKHIVDENSVFDDQVGERDVGIASPLPTDSILGAGDSRLSSSVLPLSHASSIKRSIKNMSFFVLEIKEEIDEIAPLLEEQIDEKEQKLNVHLDYLSYLIHMAVFAILGVMTRYGLQQLFGPGNLGVTSANNALYLDLLSNVVGSFLMGWFGVVFKEDLRHFSEQLTVGVTTGYMGSLTTFSGWNQSMVVLSANGYWASAILGMVFGMWVVDRSVDVGVWSARCLRTFMIHKLHRDPETGRIVPENWRIDRPNRHGLAMLLMFLILCCLYLVSGFLGRKRLDELSVSAELWLGCLVAAPGVWSRWYLARLNGRGVGKQGYLQWLPIGTLLANFVGACTIAGVATIANAVNTSRCDIVIGAVKLGFMGCLSTVSTFAVEVYAMRQSGREGRALAYVATTFVSSFALGTLIYSVPVWAKHYD